MKEQLYALGCLYDWSKELASCDPAYYRWNQWLFLRMWERGLAYRKTAPVNWCPGCRTVLANEQVVDGRCERSDDLGRDPRPDAVVLPRHRLRRAPARGPRPARRTGPTASRRCSATGSAGPRARRSSSASTGSTEPVKVFTTRPDTLYGATFLALAPEHPAVARLAERLAASAGDRGVRRAGAPRVAARAGGRGRREGGPATRAPRRSTRRPASRSRSGSPTSCCPTTARAPSWACPAHDQRDFEFARSYGLPVRPVYRTRRRRGDPRRR